MSLGNVTGLAVDWLSGLLYWADAGLRRLEVVRTDGRYRRLLLSASTDGIDSPSALQLHPTGIHTPAAAGVTATAAGDQWRCCRCCSCSRADTPASSPMLHVVVNPFFQLSYATGRNKYLATTCPWLSCVALALLTRYGFRDVLFPDTATVDATSYSFLFSSARVNLQMLL